MQSMSHPKPCPNGLFCALGSLWPFGAGKRLRALTRATVCWHPPGLDLDLVRTLVGSQKDPDCLGREPVAFCRGGTLLGAELRPVLGYAEYEVGELRRSELSITQVEEPTPFIGPQGVGDDVDAAGRCLFEVGPGEVGEPFGFGDDQPPQ